MAVTGRTRCTCMPVCDAANRIVTQSGIESGSSTAEFEGVQERHSPVDFLLGLHCTMWQGAPFLGVS